jgi:MFS family permease
MVVTLFPEPRERARAIGVVTFVGAAGASLGLVLGGVLTEALGWRSVFLVNLPIGVLALAAAMRALPRDRGAGLAAGADVPGAVLVTAGLMLGVATIVQAPDRGWTSPWTLGAAAAAVGLLAGFVLRQARATRPLLPLRIFRSRAVSGANGAQVLMIAAALGFQFLSALFLQQVLGYGAARTGLAVLPVAVSIGLLSLGPAGRLAQRFGPRPVLLAGLPAQASYPVDLLPALLLLGAGAGLALPTVTALAMSDATEADAGLASGLANTSQQIGGALGISVLAAVAAARTAALGGSGPVALAGGFRLAFALAGVLALGALAVAAVALRTPASRAVRRARPCPA